MLMQEVECSWKLKLPKTYNSTGGSASLFLSLVSLQCHSIAWSAWHNIHDSNHHSKICSTKYTCNKNGIITAISYLQLKYLLRSGCAQHTYSNCYQYDARIQTAEKQQQEAYLRLIKMLMKIYNDQFTIESEDWKWKRC